MTESTEAKTTPKQPSWRRYVNSILAEEISTFTRYFDALLQWSPRESDSGVLFEAIESPRKSVVHLETELAEEMRTIAPQGRAAVVLNGNLNHDLDIEKTLANLRPHINRESRLVLVVYNPYLRFLYRLANSFGLRSGEAPCTFVTENDVQSLAKLGGFEVVRCRLAGYCPWRLGGVGDLINKIMPVLPLIRWTALAEIITLRPIVAEEGAPSLSVVIPARNERGNIENALLRLPELPGGGKLEVIFVEGHSNDGTWEEIQRVIPLYAQRFPIYAYQQTGKGKSDAVRLGFSKASHDLLVILDADLTMPPELLVRFYAAWRKGLGDFINGNRLAYPMEGEAMRPLNHLGNLFFAKAVSYVLGARLGDTLCGTKLMTRRDYARMTAWRKDFGDFDPFGDFEMLFPAALFALGIVDVPIRYRDRTYGSTNISRFRHGWMLLKMTMLGFFRAKLGMVADH